MSKKVSFESNNKKPHIALLLMCKNETKRIHVTLNSVVGHVDSLVAYDTGSTDNTLDILKEFSEKHKIPLRLKEGVFENFAVSRNVSLNFADTFDDIDYLLMMDVNDELRGGNELRAFAKEYMNKSETGFLVCQEWYSGSYSKYFNMRFIKARTGWRYMGRVHEWLKNILKNEEDQRLDVIRVGDKVVLFQDRTLDDDKTGKRFYRDKELLLEDHHEDPTEPRTVFYLAQTCSCLNQHEEAYYYFKLRTTMIGFYEERFQASQRCGELTQLMGHDWSESMGWYMKAYELIPRAEPMIKIAEYYKDRKQWKLAFIFGNLACCLTYPSSCVLFVDKLAYDYYRWHLMGIIGWYSENFIEGKSACLNALKFSPNSESNIKNLKFYEDRERENETRNISKEEFIDKKISELSAQNPRQPRSQLYSRAKLMWEARNR